MGRGRNVPEAHFSGRGPDHARRQCQPV